MCWWDLTGELTATLKNVEIDAEVTAEINLNDLNILIADVLKFDISLGGPPYDTIDVDLENDLGIIDMIIESIIGWFELLTNGISEKKKELVEKAKKFIIDMIPFCVKPDGKCKNEGQL